MVSRGVEQIMHKKSQILYDILKGYVRNLNIQHLVLNGWEAISRSNSNLGNKTTLTFTYLSRGEEFTRDFCIIVPLDVELPYLYRALYELQNNNNVVTNLREHEVAKILDTRPLTTWEILIRETE